MKRLFLGVGVGFPIKLDPRGFEQDKFKFGLEIAEYEESIRQSIWIILGTAQGERVMRPDFGCGIYDLVFELKTSSTFSKISQTVREALLKFEPRIDVSNIQINSVSTPEGEKLLINIEYQVRATNNAFNLVYPFYLERSPG